jgi:nitrite reductase/ring-hydroxylating ferredoxin subunit/uncharacterized membrane protein
MPQPQKVIQRLESFTALDKVTKPLSNAVGKAVQQRAVRNLLSGTNLGHPLHPMLTDVTIGAWSMASLLDVVGGRAGAPAADLLVGAGVGAAVPTAASGLNDWSDLLGGERRIGSVHGLANVVALGLQGASLAARRRGQRGRGKALGFAGISVLTVGGYLGGHLSYVKGVGVNHTAFEEPPTDWTPVLADAELSPGEHRQVTAGDMPVLLVRSRGQVLAIAATCSHAGGPLAEGELADGCVTCPWHGSTFRLDDGVIVRGPATTPQPTLQAQVRDGQIEVRAAG